MNKARERVNARRLQNYFWVSDLSRGWLQPWMGWHHLLASQPTWSAGFSEVSRLCPRLQPQRCTKTPSCNRIRSLRRWIWAAGGHTVVPQHNADMSVGSAGFTKSFEKHIYSYIGERSTLPSFTIKCLRMLKLFFLNSNTVTWKKATSDKLWSFHQCFFRF